MKTRYYINPGTEQSHIYNHGVTEPEAEYVLRHPGEDRSGANGVRVVLGQTETGRYLRVIYVPDPAPDSVFVITAYDLAGKPLLAY